MQYGAALISGLGGALAAVLGAWALVIKAKSTAARPGQLLRRLMDWLESTDLDKEIPHTLASEIRETIGGGEENDVPRPRHR